MDVVKCFGKYPNMSFYMWLYKIIKTEYNCPKVIWYVIIKKSIEMLKFEILMEILINIKPDIVLFMGRYGYLSSSLYYFPLEDTYVDYRLNIMLRRDVMIKDVPKIKLLSNRKILFMPDKFLYEGEMHETDTNLYFYGRGKHFSKVGCVKGSFDFNILNGYGVSETDKGKYCGEHKNGKCHGYGSYYSIFGCIKYKGQWKNNMKHGKGISYYYNKYLDAIHYEKGTKYFGKIKYIGEFVDGKMNGYGIKYLYDRQIEGIFLNGKILMVLKTYFR